MSLRKKTILIFGIVLTCLIFIIHVFSLEILMKSFERMENQSCEKNLEMAVDNLDDYIQNLESSVRDWSIWDDTYNFMQNQNKAYLDSNLHNGTFASLKINYILYFNSDNKLVYQKGYDLEKQVDIPVGEDITKKLNPANYIAKSKNNDGTKGIFFSDSGPAIMVSHSILKSDSSGTPMGTLIMVQNLNARFTQRLSRALHMNIEVKSLLDKAISSDYTEAQNNISDVTRIHIVPQSNFTIAGYKIINDIFSKPTIMVRILVMRDIYKKGRVSMIEFVLVSLLSCLVFFLLTIFINEYIIIRRLLKLNKGVLDISHSNNFSNRVEVQGKDELSSLSASINGMLFALEEHINKLTDKTEQLSEVKAFLESVFNTVSDGICVLDKNYTINSCNTALINIFGYSFSSIKNKNAKEFFPPSFHDKIVYYKNELLEKGNTHFETYMRKSDGTTFPAEIDASVLKDRYGNFSSYVVVIYDITGRKKAEKALQSKTEEQALLLDNTDIQIWYLTDPLTYGSVNDAHAKMLKMDKLFIQNQKIYNIYKDQKVIDTFIRYNSETFETKRKKHFELEFKLENDGTKIFNVITTPKLDKKGRVEYIICTAEDITQRKQSEAKIKYLSYHDKLTGLYNRAYFEDGLKRLDMEDNLPISIIIGDLNGLKIANDIFGHDAGDKLLIEIAEILKSSCRDNDTIARWGGDEFAIILPSTREETALEICRTITEKCNDTGNSLIKTNIALGSSTKTDSSKDMKQMIKEAEDKMYRHKLLENKSSRSSYVSLLEKTLFERNYETEEHAQRMRVMSVELGAAIGLNESKLDELNLLAALHDIGKIAIPDSILLKTGPLTEEEFEVMKKHPEIGYRIAILSPELAPIAEPILTHHERWDGKGYPQGLKGEDIQVVSRIISIVDTFDAMTNKRPYKNPVSKEEALNEIKRCSGTQFDPELVKVFVELVEKKGI